MRPFKNSSQEEEPGLQGSVGTPKANGGRDNAVIRNRFGCLGYSKFILRVANNTGLWICGQTVSGRSATRGMGGSCLRTFGLARTAAGQAARAAVEFLLLRRIYDSVELRNLFSLHIPSRKIAQTYCTRCRPSAHHRPDSPPVQNEACQKPEKLPVSRLLRQFQFVQGVRGAKSRKDFFDRLTGEKMLRRHCHIGVRMEPG